jgi:hypothetical protein
MKMVNSLLIKNCGDKEFVGHYILREVLKSIIIDLGDHGDSRNETFFFTTLKDQDHEHIFI